MVCVCRVQNLSLRYNNVTDKGAELLGQVLGTTTQQNQKLVSLNLTGNKLTDVGAEHLAKVRQTKVTVLTNNIEIQNSVAIEIFFQIDY